MTLSVFRLGGGLPLLALSIVNVSGAAPRVYTLELPDAPAPILRGHLDLGGTNPLGESITVNSHYIERAGRPFFPVVGEFHYSRYPAAQWDEEIGKMKAGGLNVIATYVFWNMHERTEGTFDWSGNLNLRHFIELCAKNDLVAIVRLGPFCHGEIRNGGLPDWLYGRAFEVRSNDPGYLAYVDRLYGQIARQLRGLLYRDGGPVIGVQLENEFQHSAAPWELTYPGAPREWTVADRDVGVTHVGVSTSAVENPYAEYGQDHMVNLKRLAKKNGIDVPLYTATGWGNAAIVPKGSIPVTAGYAYPFWAPLDPTPFYLYKDIRAQPDYAPVSFDTELYPSLPAELGAGISPTYARRPRVPPESMLPLIVRTIGSGSNGIGYYMYHGGSTPVFEQFYSEQAGGIAKINYDYQAPLGEYGQARLHYHELKLVHLFLDSHAADLAPMSVVLPPTNAAITPSDTSTLRYAVRAAGERGFVFMHNFQDHVTTTDLADLRIELGGDRKFAFPHEGTFTLRSGASAILPFGMPCGPVELVSATVQPLATFRTGDVTHRVFFSIPGLAPELVFRGSSSVQTRNGRTETRDGVTIVRGPADATFTCEIEGQTFVVIPRALALGVSKVSPEQLWFADAVMARNDDIVELTLPERESVVVHAYPAAPAPVGAEGAKIGAAASQHEMLSAFSVTFERREPAFTVTPASARKFVVKAGATPNPDLHDIWMRIPYVGDRGMAFIDGELVADHLFFGEAWEIGLQRFAPWDEGKEMVLVFHPVREGQTFLQDLDPEVRPEFETGKSTHLAFGEPSFIPVYQAAIAAP